MRKNEIICAFYNPEAERFDKYRSFMKVEEYICRKYISKNTLFYTDIKKSVTVRA